MFGWAKLELGGRGKPHQPVLKVDRKGPIFQWDCSPLLKAEEHQASKPVRAADGEPTPPWGQSSVPSAHFTSQYAKLETSLIRHYHL